MVSPISVVSLWAKSVWSGAKNPRTFSMTAGRVLWQQQPILKVKTALHWCQKFKTNTQQLCTAVAPFHTTGLLSACVRPVAGLSGGRRRRCTHVISSCPPPPPSPSELQKGRRSIPAVVSAYYYCQAFWGQRPRRRRGRKSSIQAGERQRRGNGRPSASRPLPGP